MTKKRGVFRVYQAAVDGGERIILEIVPRLKNTPTGPEGPDQNFFIPPEVEADDVLIKLREQQLEAGVGTHASRVEAGMRKSRKNERI